jgi:hypothetical protein
MRWNVVLGHLFGMTEPFQRKMAMEDGNLFLVELLPTVSAIPDFSLLINPKPLYL